MLIVMRTEMLNYAFLKRQARIKISKIAEDKVSWKHNQPLVAAGK
jgi:hypothetical protein